MADDNRILETLSEMRDDFRAHVAENELAHGRIGSALDANTAEMSRHGEEEREMRRHVFGNGEAGLSEQIRKITQFQNSIRKMLWIIMPAAIVSAGSLVWSVLLWYIKKGEGL